MNIVYEDKDKIIVDKPAGQLSQSGKSFDMDLVSEIMNYQKSKGEEPYAAIINRLDRPVSGLVLVAKNKQAAARYSQLISKKEELSTFNKHYRALICGKLDKIEGIFVDYLEFDKKNNVSKVVKSINTDSDSTGVDSTGVDSTGVDLTGRDCTGEYHACGDHVYADHACADFAKKDELAVWAKKAILEYKVTEYNEEHNISKVEINLITGRHHQIRAQFAGRGHTLVGDYKYWNGTKEEMDAVHKLCGLKRNEIALCATQLEFDGTVVSIEPIWDSSRSFCK